MQVLFFYPLDFTFVCPTEIRAFSDRVAEFEKLGVAVVAASVDSEYAHLAWTQQSRKEGGLGPMKIPILADITKNISRSYGQHSHTATRCLGRSCLDVFAHPIVPASLC